MTWIYPIGFVNERKPSGLNGGILKIMKDGNFCLFYSFLKKKKNKVVLNLFFKAQHFVLHFQLHVNLYSSHTITIISIYFYYRIIKKMVKGSLFYTNSIEIFDQ